MKIGIITALPEETRALLKNVPRPEKSRQYGFKTYRYCSAGHSLTLIEAGMGARNAGRAAELLALSERPELLISAGLGGGILPGLIAADVVVAEKVFLCTAETLEAVPITPSSTALPGSVGGAFITSGGILDKKQLAKLLPSDARFPVVEMESAAIALAANAHGIAFLGIRSISDPWDEEPGFAIEEFCGKDMRIKPLKVLMTILRRPRIVPQLLRLAENSRAAGASLEKVFTEFLLQI